MNFCTEVRGVHLCTTISLAPWDWPLGDGTYIYKLEEETYRSSDPDLKRLGLLYGPSECPPLEGGGHFDPDSKVILGRVQYAVIQGSMQYAAILGSMEAFRSLEFSQATIFKCRPF